MATAAEKARASRGRRQRANSPKGQLRAPHLGAIYTRQLRDITAGDFDFRVVLVRPEKPKPERTMILDRGTTSVEWIDDGPVLTGSLTLHRPGPYAVTALPIREAHRIRLLVRWGDSWYRLWEMRVGSDPEPTGSTGDLHTELADDLANLRHNEREWAFTKTKHRKKGWPPQAVARAVGRREGVPLGKIAKGQARIRKLRRKCSGLEIILRAYAAERRKTDRRFVVRLRNGRLEVIPVKRHRVLYIVKGTEIDYSTETSSPKKKRPTTVIEAKGRVGKKKVEARVFRRRILKRFGLSSVERSYGKVDSRRELREEAMRDIADGVRVKRTATLTIPGIPFIERGDTMRWITREPGWSGPGKGTRDRSYAYVKSVAHSATPGSFTSTVTVNQDDPYLAAGAGAKAKRDAKKGSRNRRRQK